MVANFSQLEYWLIVRSQLGPSIFSQVPLLVLDYRWSHNPPTNWRTVMPNWYWAHTIPKFNVQSSWTTDASYYTQHTLFSNRFEQWNCVTTCEPMDTFRGKALLGLHKCLLSHLAAAPIAETKTSVSTVWIITEKAFLRAWCA